MSGHENRYRGNQGGHRGNYRGNRGGHPGGHQQQQQMQMQNQMQQQQMMGGQNPQQMQGMMPRPQQQQQPQMPQMPQMPPQPQQQMQPGMPNMGQMTPAQRYQQTTLRILPAVTERNVHLKNQVGQIIYDFIVEIAGVDKAPKITGMLIELPIQQIKAYLSSYEALFMKVQEANEHLASAGGIQENQGTAQ